MASSLLALLDDIATVLDDVAVLTKIATKKSAGVLGDDLAVNAEQVTGVRAERELPVVWSVAKGSALNKLILVPAALLISALVPWLVTPLLMLGGLFLCYEGFEKVAHHWLDGDAEQRHREQIREALTDPSIDMVQLEKDKIKGAIRTDFILSAEIIAITLGTVAGKPLLTQFVVLSIIAAMMTVGVYGLVACIVKLDDLGLYLSRSAAAFSRAVGRGILNVAPYLMKFLAIAGTAAMFLVGGGILAHGIPGLESWVHHLAEDAGQALAALTPLLINFLLGLVAGAVTVAVVTLGQRVFAGKSDSEAH